MIKHNKNCNKSYCEKFIKCELCKNLSYNKNINANKPKKLRINTYGLTWSEGLPDFYISKL
jgi:hypothetical protein